MTTGIWNEMVWHEIDIEKFAKENGLVKTEKAIGCAKEYAKSIKRKDGRNEFVHFYIVAQISAYHVLRSGLLGNLISFSDLDDILTLALFHDIYENVSWNAWEDIKNSFGDPISFYIWIMSKNKDTSFELYYFAMAIFVVTILVKLADRLHNLRNMAKNLGQEGDFFTEKRLKEYVSETWEYIVPMALDSIERFPQYESIIEDMCEELLRSLSEAEEVLNKA